MSFPATIHRPSIVALPSPEHRTNPNVAPPAALILIQAVLEALMGRRPLHQLRPHVRGAAFEYLSSRVDGGKYRTLRLGRIRTQSPRDGAIEATVSLCLRGRWLSCVLRVEVRRQAWACTGLAVLEPPALRAA